MMDNEKDDLCYFCKGKGISKKDIRKECEYCAGSGKAPNVVLDFPEPEDGNFEKKMGNAMVRMARFMFYISSIPRKWTPLTELKPRFKEDTKLSPLKKS